MTDDSPTLTEPVSPASPTGGPEPTEADAAADHADSADAFQAALEAEVARRIEAVERRWQSRKDRELNRARRRWESEAGQAIDSELLAWIAEADPREVGQWLQAGLSADQPAERATAAANVPKPPTSVKAHDTADPTADRNGAAGEPSDSGGGGGAEATEPQDDGEEDAGAAAETLSTEDLERKADARERLAERRSLDPSPDLFPSRGAPADAFRQIEAGFARGEVNLETYETARRRRGLT